MVDRRASALVGRNAVERIATESLMDISGCPTRNAELFSTPTNAIEASLHRFLRCWSVAARGSMSGDCHPQLGWYVYGSLSCVLCR